MGRKKKIAILNICLARKNENSIREKDVILLYDPSHAEENTRPLPSLTSLDFRPAICSANHVWCRLGCCCESINAQRNLDNFNKHCRDTGFADCIFGCCCGKVTEGHQLQTYKQLTYNAVDKPKKLRWQDDDECGFVPPGSVLNLEDGRPKRKSQPPERFRHDIGGEKGERARKKAKLDKGATENKTAETRRQIADRSALPGRPRNRFYRSCSSNVRNYAETNGNDSDESKPRPKHANGLASSHKNDIRKRDTTAKPKAQSRKTFNKSVPIAPSVIYGKPLSVVQLDHSQEDLLTVVRDDEVGSKRIVSFVEFTKNLQFPPSVSCLGNVLRSNTIKEETKCSTLMRLPFVDSNSVAWYFYDIPEDYADGSFIMFPNLHAIISTAALQLKINSSKPREAGEIHILSISEINSNKHERKELVGSVYLLLEYEGAIVMGTNPSFYRKPKGDCIYVPIDTPENGSSQSSIGSPNANGATNLSETSESSPSNSSQHTDEGGSDVELKES